MMNIITRYIAKEVFLSILMVTLGLSGLYLIFSFIKEAQDIGHGQYDAIAALLFTLFNLPANLYLVLPMGALLGVLIGLGHLSHHHELIVLQTSGYSIWQICRGVWVVGLLMIPFTFTLGGYISPLMSHYATVQKTLAEQREHALLMGAESIWLKDGPDFIHIGKTMPGGQLEDITRYEMEGAELKQLLFAKRAEFEEGGRWLLHHVTQTSVLSDRVVEEYFESMRGSHIIAPHLMDVVISDPEQLTWPHLGAYIEYRKENALYSGQYELMYWRIIFQPISTLLLMLFAVPFVFGLLRSSTASLRFVFGVIVGVLLYMVDQFFGPFSLVYRLDPLIGTAIPIIIFSVLMSAVFWWFKR